MFVLNDAQKEEVIAQADSHLKTAKGRGYRRQVSRPEVIQLLSGLPRDAAGLVSFHDAQKLIVGHRENQIARFKVIFPEIAGGSAKKKSSRSAAKSPPGVEYGSNSSSSNNDRSSTPTKDGVAPVRSSLGEAARGGGVMSRRAKFSADVAPAEMFIKDVGFTPAGVANHVSNNPTKLLGVRPVHVALKQQSCRLPSRIYGGCLRLSNFLGRMS